MGQICIEPHSKSHYEKLVLPPGGGGGEVDDRTFDTFLITASNRDQQKENQNSNNNSGHDEQEQKLDLLIVIVLGIFATFGIMVNALLMLSIKLEKRTLFLPWLVFHLITVIGRCLVLPSSFKLIRKPFIWFTTKGKAI